MNPKVETVEGTQPHPHVEHEPRTVRRAEMMMTEIGDGVFVQWGECRTCKNRVPDCTCKGGPVEPPYMQAWRDDRFKRELEKRPDPDYDLLPRILEWVRERGFTVNRPGDKPTERLMRAAEAAQKAAGGDSNDDEIDLLRDALGQALDLLGLELPEAADPFADEDAEESPVRVRFQPQAWVNDNAMDVDPEGPAEWFVSKETAADIPSSNDLDFVRGDDFAPKWVADWSGPFEITVIEPDVEDERDHEETGPDGDARTYDPESGDKIEPNDDRLKGREFDAGF